MQQRLRTWTPIGIAGMAILTGCPVDDRELLPGSAGFYGGVANYNTSGKRSEEGGAAGDKGSGGNNPSSAGTNRGGTSQADGGEPATGNGLIDGCVDLDQNKVGDCDETLVDNFDFRSGVEDWVAGGGVDLAWSEQNNFPDLPSGSASVAAVGAVNADGLTQAATIQCVPVAGQTKLKVFANGYIAGGQGEGLAEVGIWFYEQAGCNGIRVEPFSRARAESDAWMTFNGECTAPATALSMAVRLAVTKPMRTPRFEVLFDNVLVKRQ